MSSCNKIVIKKQNGLIAVLPKQKEKQIKAIRKKNKYKAVYIMWRVATARSTFERTEVAKKTILYQTVNKHINIFQ